MNNNRRAQAPKVRLSNRNEAFNEATITRHAASARPHRLKTDYRRKPKHTKRGWE